MPEWCSNLPGLDTSPVASKPRDWLLVLVFPWLKSVGVSLFPLDIFYANLHLKIPWKLPRVGACCWWALMQQSPLPPSCCHLGKFSLWAGWPPFAKVHPDVIPGWWGPHMPLWPWGTVTQWHWPSLLCSPAKGFQSCRVRSCSQTAPWRFASGCSQLAGGVRTIRRLRAGDWGRGLSIPVLSINLATMSFPGN